MHHFFVTQNQIDQQRITITGSDVNHIKNVLRMKCGEELLVSNGQGTDYHCRISEIRFEAVIAEILKTDQEGKELPAQLYLFQGLPKQEKMDWIIQKAVELGAYEIIPVEMARSVVRLDSKKEEAKRKRWNSIAESGAKQSKRSIIPQVSHVMNMKEALEYGDRLDIKLILYENARGMEMTREMVEQVRPGMKVGIFVGPEGGFEVKEVEQAVASGVCPVSLGKRILRTETAGMAILSILMYHLETQYETCKF